MTPAPRALPRRTLLAVSGTAVLAAAAACSSAGTTAESAASTASSAASSVKESTSAAGSAKAPVAADPTTSAAATPAGTVIASLADVESAGSVVVNAPSGPVLLASEGGTVVCHTAICTHQQCTVAASGACPCHGSKFNITTGAVENGPAQQPLAEVAVTVSGGQVYAT